MLNVLEIVTAGKEDVSQYVRLLVSGLPGVGKTRFATSAPNPIWAACNPGYTPLAEQGIRYVNILNENTLFDLKVGIENGQIEADTLVVDTVDDLQDRLFDQKLKAEGRSVRKNDDWNWVEAKMNGIFDTLSSLPIHIVYITHTKDVGGFDGVDLEVKNNLQGGPSSQIYKYVDFAAILQSKAFPDGESDSLINESRLQLQATPKYPVAFDDTDLLDSFIYLDYNEDDFQVFVDAKEKHIKELDSQTKTEVEVGELEEVEDAPEKVEIPGMSKQKDISKFLKKNK